VERDERGHWLPGRSANPGGRPGIPEVIKATLRELSLRAVERLGELLDSEDERIRLEGGNSRSASWPSGNPGRHLPSSRWRGRSPCGAGRDGPPSRPGPITLEDDEVEIISTTPSSTD
jgi:hypothetical protein